MRRIIPSVMLSATLLLASPFALAVNINKADAAAIAEELKGVGKTKAEAIVKERQKNGPFKNGEDLAARVKGIGPATVAKNKDRLQF
ncbi:competence protein ComEA [Methylomarinovum tepidoasis]|uniref:Competence protein ComEA n=1 Tax=Methylomarinovum tepidoasis TaxID=2840183 RepID=A0AAU9CTH8_9GAMM|nr:helix-hairpin-helix domain-containing protein [Methylomarinovum sp. IN45]BCX87910.1 competence protein ComEA [Methylomarinovum sp. IN45]